MSSELKLEDTSVKYVNDSKKTNVHADEDGESDGNTNKNSEDIEEQSTVIKSFNEENSHLTDKNASEIDIQKSNGEQDVDSLDKNKYAINRQNKTIESTKCMDEGIDSQEEFLLRWDDDNENIDVKYDEIGIDEDALLSIKDDTDNEEMTQEIPHETSEKNYDNITLEDNNAIKKILTISFRAPDEHVVESGSTKIDVQNMVTDLYKKSQITDNNCQENIRKLIPAAKTEGDIDNVQAGDLSLLQAQNKSMNIEEKLNVTNISEGKKGLETDSCSVLYQNITNEIACGSVPQEEVKAVNTVSKIESNIDNEVISSIVDNSKTSENTIMSDCVESMILDEVTVNTSEVHNCSTNQIVDEKSNIPEIINNDQTQVQSKHDNYMTGIVTEEGDSKTVDTNTTSDNSVKSTNKIDLKATFSCSDTNEPETIKVIGIEQVTETKSENATENNTEKIFLVDPEKNPISTKEDVKSLDIHDLNLCITPEIKTDHAINKPDIMLEIPTQELIDMDDNDSTLEQDISLDNESEFLKKVDDNFLQNHSPVSSISNEDMSIDKIILSLDDDDNVEESHKDNFALGSNLQEGHVQKESKLNENPVEIANKDVEVQDVLNENIKSNNINDNIISTETNTNKNSTEIVMESFKMLSDTPIHDVSKQSEVENKPSKYYYYYDDTDAQPVEVNSNKEGKESEAHKSPVTHGTSDVDVTAPSLNTEVSDELEKEPSFEHNREDTSLELVENMSSISNKSHEKRSTEMKEKENTTVVQANKTEKASKEDILTKQTMEIVTSTEAISTVNSIIQSVASSTENNCSNSTSEQLTSEAISSKSKEEISTKQNMEISTEPISIGNTGAKTIMPSSKNISNNSISETLRLDETKPLNKVFLTDKVPEDILSDSEILPLASETISSTSDSLPVSKDLLVASEHSSSSNESVPFEDIPTLEPVLTISGVIPSTLESVPTTFALTTTPSEAISPATEAIPITSKDLPSTSEAIPLNSETIPSISKPIPSNSEVMPSSQEALPFSSKSIPPTSESIPPTCEAISTTSEVTSLISEVVSSTLKPISSISETMPLTLEAVLSTKEAIPLTSESILPTLNSIPPSLESVQPISQFIPPTSDTIPSISETNTSLTSDALPSIVETMPPTLKTILSTSEAMTLTLQAIPSSLEAMPSIVDAIPLTSESISPISKDILATSEAEVDGATSEVESSNAEPVPSTSATVTSEVQPSSPKIEMDMSEQNLEIEDSLGLLAESSRVMDYDEEIDDDECDDDDDMDLDDESSNHMTAEHSEDSNAPNSENEVQKESLPIPISAKEKEDIQTAESRNILTAEHSKKSIINSEDDEQKEEDKLVTEGEIEKDNIQVDDVGCDDIDITEDTIGIADEQVEELITTKKLPKPDEMDKKEQDKQSDTSKAEVPTLREKVDIVVEVESPEANKQSPSKMKNFTITNTTHYVNIIDLEESSSEDDVTVQETSKETIAVVQDSTPINIDITELQNVPPIKTILTAVKESDVTTAEIVDAPPKPTDEASPIMDKAANTTLDPSKSAVVEETVGTSKPKVGLEIFNLDSDDEEMKEVPKPEEPDEQRLKPKEEELLKGRRRSNKCINLACKSIGNVYYKADSSIVAHYDAARKKLPLVCETCVQEFSQSRLSLIEGVKNMTPLLELLSGRLPEDCVEISDSDSEEEGDLPIEVEKELVGEAGAKLLEDSLAELINDSWKKYKMDARLNDTTELLNKELETLDGKLVIVDTPDKNFTCNESYYLMDQMADAEKAQQNAKRRTKKIAIPLGYAPLNNDPHNKQESKPLTPATETSLKVEEDKDVSVVQLSAEVAPPDLPACGDVNRPNLKVGLTVYAVRNAFAPWLKARILELTPKGTKGAQYTMCRVKFETTVKNPFKVLSARDIAYEHPTDVRLTIGTRIIALFKDAANDGKRESYYSGIVAEVPTPVNNFRLAPLYLELQAAQRHRNRPLPRSKAQTRSNMPYVEYTRPDEPNSTKETELQAQQRQQEEIRRQRAVAKKSTMASSTPTNQPPSIVESPLTTRVVYYTPKNAVKPYKMTPHNCSAKCKRTDVLGLKELRTYNPLAKPLLSGWERQIIRYKGQKDVMYRAPCGRRLRNMRELHTYLRTIGSEMAVDLFDFHPNTHCLAEFVVTKCLVGKKDLSHGRENVPIPCVNTLDKTLPEFCSYNTDRTPTAGVPLNLDPEFLCGCDCTDDCEDKSKCACWQMTLEGAKTIGLEGSNVGYVYKRLPEPLPSGIYECNSRCKCRQTCLNRVAQHPLQLKLQVFKTLSRGWGIRALNDVPTGAFLCVYAGNLLTDATANLDGLNEGDEYLAELDYIEVVEQMKEGFEDDIPEADKKLDKKDTSEHSSEEDSVTSEEENGSKDDKQDDDFQPGYSGNWAFANDENKKTLRKRERKLKKENEEKNKCAKEANQNDDCITISDDDEVREPASFTAQLGMGAKEFVSKYKSVRAHFGRDEACYIMDAKVQGNIGRYLNHSCSPNVFVQNVFVDTHDPRFPWVAFFALCHIRAGTELTWNYNYDVGSVPDKVLYCHCGAPNCRGRLL
ncbi:hypothetical protein K1T71_000915 [Dendrolimus kikuchii]|uniref:Uncharacterized protein n=1 Tax=Dendrolimus kikuchii TaxID=765133 RepID=A0ACC1DG49_9NEOP|nr:hypothetical protein K1T71_000915 [Dendrolimus kikuchii]